MYVSVWSFKHALFKIKGIKTACHGYPPYTSNLEIDLTIILDSNIQHFCIYFCVKYITIILCMISNWFFFWRFCPADRLWKHLYIYEIHAVYLIRSTSFFNRGSVQLIIYKNKFSVFVSVLNTFRVSCEKKQVLFFKSSVWPTRFFFFKFEKISFSYFVFSLNKSEQRIII